MDVAFREEPAPHWACEGRGMRAVFTSAASGNLAAHVGDAPAEVAQHRSLLTTQLLPSPGVATVLQVHSNEVVCATEADGDWSDAAVPDVTADAVITRTPCLPIAVFTADCVPIVLSAGDVVGVVHAGWRGLAAGVIGRACDAMEMDRSATAVIGPCIGQCCYEVGDEVVRALPHTVQSRELDHGRFGQFIDLRREAALQLSRLGVDVVDIDVCTRCDDRLFSYRRDGDAAGRQAVIGWLQPVRSTAEMGSVDG